MESFHSVCRWAFRGWDEVRSYRDKFTDTIYVRLTLDARHVEAQSRDINELGSELFRGTDAWKLVEMARKQKTRLGLHRYGKRGR